MIKIYLLLLLLLTNINAMDKLYFLPDENKDAKMHIINLIKESKSSIDIAMYNIKYSKFISQLNKAASRGVKVNIFYEKKDGDFNNKINFYKTKNKLHTKIAIFDKQVIFYGSANWKKESFKKNYEVINITDKKDKVKKFNKFFNQLKEKN